jgi:hypothetical protein
MVIFYRIYSGEHRLYFTLRNRTWLQRWNAAEKRTTKKSILILTHRTCLLPLPSFLAHTLLDLHVAKYKRHEENYIYKDEVTV